MTKQETALKAVELLKQAYPDAICSLEYRKPHELMIATRLAAQCTDARVNIVCVDLFQKYPTVEAFAQADIADVEEIVRPCGFFHTKAKDIVHMCQMLMDQYNGVIPDTVEELTKLPGIGRKTANLVVGDIYHKPAVVTDTHCIRICGRLGLSEGKDPLKVEKQLREILPPEESNDFCHRLVLHGRAVCTARTAKCGECCMRDFCKYAKEIDARRREK